MKIQKPAPDGGLFYSLLSCAFRLLDDHYGDLGWWPGQTPFEIMVGAILTQNTAWSNVEKAIYELKKERLLSLAAMRRAKPEVIAQCIRPSGYYNQKTRKLIDFISFLDNEFGGSIKAMAQAEVKPLREQLLSVRGIGPETADSILLYALGKPVFVVDAYTRRIFSRLGLIKGTEEYDHIRGLFEGAAKKAGRVRFYNQFHALIVMLGKDFCRKSKPLCAACPLKRLGRCL